ncbi:MAG TPA: hypothetical protein VK659_08445 [Asanoa sp.]|nr:hypothetical protein [Asanoa sp.]
MDKFVSDDALARWFAYHAPPTAYVSDTHQVVREACHQAAYVLNRTVPECPEKTVALRKLREAMFYANAAVACHPDAVTGPPS